MFYGWANPIWAVIMFFGCSVDYVCGLVLLKLSRLPNDARRAAAGAGPEVQRTRAMRVALAISIVTNLGLLAAVQVHRLRRRERERHGPAAGLGERLVPVLHLVLPVGI